MPFVFKKKEPEKLPLTIHGHALSLLLREIPATDLFELAQLFHQARREVPRETDHLMIPAAFARKVVEAVVDTARGWEDVLDESGKPLPFSRDRLRSILESDVAVIPQLISYIAELFSRAHLERQNLEEEEKNLPASSASPSAPASSDAAGEAAV